MQKKYLNMIVHNSKDLRLMQLNADGHTGIFGSFPDLLASIAETARSLEADEHSQGFNDHEDDGCNAQEFIKEVEQLSQDTFRDMPLFH